MYFSDEHKVPWNWTKTKHKTEENITLLKDHIGLEDPEV